MDDVAHWPAAFTLDLRGAAPTATYQAMVAGRADASAGRIHLHPMATAEDLLARSHASDIGVFLPELGSRQLRIAMPNKVFEYLHAGLMLIVPEGCDMADFVRETGAGLAIDPVRQPLHTVLAGLSAQDIDSYKAAAYRASQHLTWANEARKLRALTGL